ncbi:MAG: hypothetical protein OXI41_05435 [Chloroflexota bacterium]|nr:hypothetical protein [Chloroflexota bacterium]MDE2894838.1 hypothetical protein [Chloroflexota bacterium]
MRLFRDHILRTVAADRLAEQLYLLTHPDTDPEQSQRHIATTRELCLLLLSLPDIQQPECPESPGNSRTEPQRSRTNPEPSRQVWTDLDKPGLEFDQCPVPSSKCPKVTPKSSPPYTNHSRSPVDLNINPADSVPGRLILRVTPVAFGNRRTERPP